VTYVHFDHDGVDPLDAIMILDCMARHFQFGDVKIISIAEKPMCPPWKSTISSPDLAAELVHLGGGGMVMNGTPAAQQATATIPIIMWRASHLEEVIRWRPANVEGHGLLREGP
jgi:hypothetical protein